MLIPLDSAARAAAVVHHPAGSAGAIQKRVLAYVADDLDQRIDALEAEAALILRAISTASDGHGKDLLQAALATIEARRESCESFPARWSEAWSAYEAASAEVDAAQARLAANLDESCVESLLADRERANVRVRVATKACADVAATMVRAADCRDAGVHAALDSAAAETALLEQQAELRRARSADVAAIADALNTTVVEVASLHMRVESIAAELPQRAARAEHTAQTILATHVSDDAIEAANARAEGLAALTKAGAVDAAKRGLARGDTGPAQKLIAEYGRLAGALAVASVAHAPPPRKRRREAPAGDDPADAFQRRMARA